MRDRGALGSWYEKLIEEDIEEGKVGIPTGGALPNT